MKLRETKEQLDSWNKSMYIPAPKKVLEETYNYKSISSILHGSKVIKQERIQRLKKQLRVSMWIGITYVCKKHKRQTSRPWSVMFKYFSDDLSCLLTSLKQVTQWEITGCGWWCCKWVFYHAWTCVKLTTIINLLYKKCE